MVNNRLSDHEIRNQAKLDGLLTIKAESRRLALEGITSIEEITRVL
jgi:type II secretory ATPase GspE/PulE/Tfp pilus assembly ATPase PilB-like protein